VVLKIIDCVPHELLDAVNVFSKELEWARRIPVYEVHKWWARRYSGIVRLFLAFTELDSELLKSVSDFSSFVRNLYFNPPKVKNKKLLDPFAGGGTILVEGSILGYECVGIDINKLPCLLLNSLKVLPYMDFKKFEQNIKTIADYLLDRLWRTRCLKGHNAYIIHTFLVWKNGKGEHQIRSNKIKDGKLKFYFCEKCGNTYASEAEQTRCTFCGNEFNKSKRYDKLEYCELSPYAIEYYCSTCCERNIKKTTEEDLDNFWRNTTCNLLNIPKLSETDRLLKVGIRDFSQLLTPRQLLTFEIFLNHFNTEPGKTLAKVLVSDALRSCSILAYYSEKYAKVIPAFVIKSYWLPPQPVELNPLAYRFLNGRVLPLGRGNIISAFRKLRRARNFIIQYKIELRYKILHGPAQDILPQIDETFDVIFTDPPYVNYQYYSDLSLFNLSLIKEVNEQTLTELLRKELTLRHKKDLMNYKKGLIETFCPAVDRLSNNGKLLVTFHHPDLKMLYTFLEVFKKLPIRLQAIYPVIGESSGKLIERKIYLDLLFVFGKQQRDIHYSFTTYTLTKYDKLLQSSIPTLIEFYKE
jgi:adenine-specific DNA methylase